ncbi:MAG: hydrogen gas-evolving membrane-bound hydrogenase subunit E [Haloarculaceae archaeon]
MSPDPAVLFAALALPFVGAALAYPLYRLLGERTALFAAGIAAASFGLLVTQYGAHGAVTMPWIPELGVSLTLYWDGLASLIAFLATGMGVLVFTYSYGYMHAEPGKRKYYPTLLAFMGAMLGVALAADLVLLFLFWELTSVTSFMLIGHYGDESGQYAARKSMLITVAGGLFMLVGFLLLAFVSGNTEVGRTFTLVGEQAVTLSGETVELESMIGNSEIMREGLREAGLFLPAMLLVGVGAATKSAQVPFHSWLPNAMEAPTPVSAFLHSATMVKAGVYLVGRVRPLFLPETPQPDWMLVFATLGLISMTVTAILAVGATDIKELLAYSTASHLSLIVAGFGLAGAEGIELGAETGAFHVFNHAVFKAALFLVAGIIAHEAGTRAIDELGGLRREMPVVAGITAIAALGMAGVPPFNGFWSKELLFETTYLVAAGEGGLFWLYPAVAVFGSVFTFLYSIRFLMLFFGEKPDALGGTHIHRPPVSMLAPPALLAVIAAVVGIVPQVAIDGIVQSAFESALPPGVEAHALELSLAKLVDPTPWLGMSLLTVALGAVAYQGYGSLHRGVRRARSVPVWSPDWYYDTATAGAEWLGTATDRHVHSGLFRTYAGTLLLGVSALALGGYVAAGAVLPALGGIDVAVPVVLVLLVAVVGAIAVAVAPSHVAGVLTLSILGFMIAVFFVLAAAPDLALTQLVVETLLLVIFLLVIDRLPAYYGEIRRRRAVVDLLVAGTVGVTVFITVVLATAGRPDDPIFGFFVERAPVPAEHGPYFTDFGGGGNIVNVILVDFRAFDTLGEITVVALAALSVLTMVAMRGRGRGEDASDVPGEMEGGAGGEAGD